MDDLLSTPVVRTGPSSRLIRRQSGLPEKPRDLKTPNVEKSFRILDEAIGSPTLTFQRPGIDISHMPRVASDPLESTMFNTSARDVSVFLPPSDKSMLTSRFDQTRFDKNQSLLSATLYSADLEENPGVQGTENLFDEFLGVINCAATPGLDSLPEFEYMLQNHICRLRKLLISLPTFRDKNPKTAAVCEDLINERNTWIIMNKLYTDRLITSTQCNDDAALLPHNPTSEKRIIETFFKTNTEARQAYIVVDWLERIAKDESEMVITQHMEWFTDATICWENTTSSLCRGQTKAGMVKQLDPDAPNRTGLSLHDLDVEDDAKLLTCIIHQVRCGLLDEAQELCNRLGQSWRAATLEGWKLYHDPNYESATDGRQGQDKLAIEGNKHRDIWKKVAWGLTKDKSMLQVERCIYAALCGNLEQLNSICKSWEDKLWAGVKCALDVMVETEIRSQLIKNFAELPVEYWNSPTSLSKVIAEASSGLSESSNVNKYRKIQAHLILDDYGGLLLSINTWLSEGSLQAHMLRLVTHMVLVHRGLGIHGDPELEENILTEYTRYLMSRDKLDLIPWYVSKLEVKNQAPLHSAYLSGVDQEADQALCLQLGLECGLDIGAMIVSAVTTLRSSQSVDNEAMVASLGWLTHHPDQIKDLLYQTNAVIRRLLSLGQVELAGEALAKVGRDTQAQVLAAWRDRATDDSLDDNLVREYLALKVYLEAQETFSDWFDHFHRGQPIRPIMPQNATFTEKVAHEQKEKQYLVELNRWRGGQLIQSRQAEEKLKQVLQFAGGWLLEAQNVDDDEGMMDEEQAKRQSEMSALRTELIPQTFLLLHSVLHNTGQYQAAINLANLLADESTSNYAAFSKDKIKQFLAKIRESSLAVLDEGKDPWGFQKP